MTEEERIKQWEKEQLTKLLEELNNVNKYEDIKGVFKYYISKYHAGLLLKYINNLQQRIDKAIEYAKTHEEAQELLSILQG